MARPCHFCSRWFTGKQAVRAHLRYCERYHDAKDRGEVTPWWTCGGCGKRTKGNSAPAACWQCANTGIFINSNDNTSSNNSPKGGGQMKTTENETVTTMRGIGYIPVMEVAQALGYNPSTLYKWCNEGLNKIEFIKKGQLVFIAERWIAVEKRRVAKEGLRSGLGSGKLGVVGSSPAIETVDARLTTAEVVKIIRHELEPVRKTLAMVEASLKLLHEIWDGGQRLRESITSTTTNGHHED